MIYIELSSQDTRFVKHVALVLLILDLVNVILNVLTLFTIAEEFCFDQRPNKHGNGIYVEFIALLAT